MNMSEIEYLSSCVAQCLWLWHNVLYCGTIVLACGTVKSSHRFRRFTVGNVGMLKTRKIGLSWKLFRGRNWTNRSETFCKTQTRWIGHTNFILALCPSLCFGWFLGVQDKISRSGGVTTLNQILLSVKEIHETKNSLDRNLLRENLGWVYLTS